MYLLTFVAGIDLKIHKFEFTWNNESYFNVDETSYIGSANYVVRLS